jgi:hypothetical protein
MSNFPMQYLLESEKATPNEEHWQYWAGFRCISDRGCESRFQRGKFEKNLTYEQAVEKVKMILLATHVAETRANPREFTLLFCMII